LVSLEIKILAKILRRIFGGEVFSKLSDEDISEKSLDERTLKLLEGRTFEFEYEKKQLK